MELMLNLLFCCLLDSLYFNRCDADPEVLSDYVLALLRHDATDGDLLNLLIEQLEDFLAESECHIGAKRYFSANSL